MGRSLPEIRVTSSADGLGIVLVIANPGSAPVTVLEPHPHASVVLHDAAGQPWPMHYGVFAAKPRWRVTVPPGEVRQRIVTLPRFFLDAQGTFVAECVVAYRVGEQTEWLTIRGSVRLALPTADEYYSEAGAAARHLVQCYEQCGFTYPGPDGAEPGAAADRPRE